MKTTLNITLLALALLAGVLVSSSVRAQSSDGRIAIRHEYGNPYYFYGHASTYEEGVLRGWADVWRGAGDYNYNTSLANINNQEAFSRSLDNSLKRTEVYFARQALNRQARESARPARPSAEDIARFAKERAPNGLAAHEYTPALGTLHWPAILGDDLFAAERTQLDWLFATRSTADSGLGSENYHKVKQTVDQLEARLKNRISVYSPAEYVAAKSFLNRLERESLDRVSTIGVAVK